MHTPTVKLKQGIEVRDMPRDVEETSRNYVLPGQVTVDEYNQLKSHYKN
jgi:hypothetical protein